MDDKLSKIEEALAEINRVALRYIHMVYEKNLELVNNGKLQEKKIEWLIKQLAYKDCNYVDTTAEGKSCLKSRYKFWMDKLKEVKNI